MCSRMITTLGLSVVLNMALIMPESVWAMSTPVFSQAEQHFLNQHGILRLCTDPDWMPYEGINSRGKYAGIMAEFHALWAKQIPSKIRFIHTRNWQQSLQFIKQKRCDILSSAQAVDSRKAYLNVTQPLIFYPYALATRPEFDNIVDLSAIPKGNSVVMVEGYAGVNYIRRHYPALSLITVTDAEKGLRQVEKGLALGYIDTVPSINYQVLQHGIAHIKINSILNEGYSMAVGVRADMPKLLSIYNKLIQSTDDSDRQRILHNWLAIESAHNQVKWQWQALLIVSLILVLFVCRYALISRHNRHLRQVNQLLSHISHRDQLTGLHNRHYLQLAFERELVRRERYQQELCLILLDIDHFKQINDSFGHLIGDEVIKRLSQLMHVNLRKNDVLARWGGEEFLVLCPDTSLSAA